MAWAKAGWRSRPAVLARLAVAFYRPLTMKAATSGTRVFAPMGPCRLERRAGRAALPPGLASPSAKRLPAGAQRDDRAAHLGGIDAFAGVEDPVEPRRRYQAGRTLDALEKLKLGWLGGTLDQAMPPRLKSLSADLRGKAGG